MSLPPVYLRGEGVTATGVIVLRCYFGHPRNVTSKGSYHWPRVKNLQPKTGREPASSTLPEPNLDENLALVANVFRESPDASHLRPVQKKRVVRRATEGDHDVRRDQSPLDYSLRTEGLDHCDEICVRSRSHSGTYPFTVPVPFQIFFDFHLRLRITLNSL